MKKIDLVEILKDCPIGTKLYSPICGECSLLLVKNPQAERCPIKVETAMNVLSFTYDGRLFLEDEGECLLFPSKNQRDWGKFSHKFAHKDVNIEGRDLGDIITNIDNRLCEIELALSKLL